MKLSFLVFMTSATVCYNRVCMNIVESGVKHHNPNPILIKSSGER